MRTKRRKTSGAICAAVFLLLAVTKGYAKTDVNACLICSPSDVNYTHNVTRQHREKKTEDEK